MAKTILTDIGGTHIRLAVMGPDGPAECARYPVTDFPDLVSALSAYSPGKTGRLYIATAAWPHDDGNWRFARPGRWVIAPDALAAAGWDLAYIGNDFAASALGAVTQDQDALHTIRPAAEAQTLRERCAVLGAGTGLGLAYVQNGTVHETYGGHMDIPQRTEEQHMIIRLVRRLKDNDRPVCAEDAISGPGLMLLYRAACLMHGTQAVCETPDGMFDTPGDPAAAQALRLFHELLGLFAHNAVLYGHAFGSLYIDGGIAHKLAAAGLFDTSAFLAAFTGDPLPLVKDRLGTVPVYIVTDPYIALRGLARKAEHGA